MPKGFISEQMGSNRILSHGKITSLPFKFNSYNPASLFIIPKVENGNPILINCRLYMDDTISPCPFVVNAWTETAVMEIPTGGVDLANYDIYWGAGADVSES